MNAEAKEPPRGGGAAPATIRVLLCGDVMLGRGIDQILPHSTAPTIPEQWREIDDARIFVELAVRCNGPLPEPRDAAYVWGDVLGEICGAGADLRLANLETAVSTSDDLWPDKPVRYRTHPGNVETLRAARLDCCSLANNHVLDWGYRGLAETLDTLRRANIASVGAGRDRREADTPAVFDVPGKGRVAVFGFATPGSGVPQAWAAGPGRPGVSLIDLSERFAAHIAALVRAAKSNAGIAIASIHWGGNWGHEIPPQMRRFAHRLIDEAGIDVIHGHSSHHVRAIEVYRERLILYGCGDLINDYEGIPLHDHPRSAGTTAGYSRFRAEFGLIYRAGLDAASGALQSLDMVPTRIRNMRVNRVDAEGVRWLEETLNREGGAFGTAVALEDGLLKLRW
jgi:poly-gamma-glutamate synthesis protein (capsule biosynthesis protein)